MVFGIMLSLWYTNNNIQDNSLKFYTNNISNSIITNENNLAATSETILSPTVSTSLATVTNNNNVSSELYSNLTTINDNTFIKQLNDTIIGKMDFLNRINRNSNFYETDGDDGIDNNSNGIGNFYTTTTTNLVSLTSESIINTTATDNNYNLDNKNILHKLIDSTIEQNATNFLLNNTTATINNLNEIFFNNLTDNNEQYLSKLLNINDSSIVDGNDDGGVGGGKRDYVFDRTDVRIIFITLYCLVFCCCFFGNLLVILVVTLSRRLRSITNFFLANLAVADFCVGVFCVMQNLTIYLIDSWVFGEFLCRMYQFIHSLSYTASIFILVVICMERYFAIIHPITCKQILTPSRLRVVILGVWITSAVYSTPKFIFSKTITNIHTLNGIEEDICVLDRQMFNSELLDLINFGFLYVTPLLVMTILYSRIAIALWKSSRGLERHIALQNTTTCSPSTVHHFRKPSIKYEKRNCVGVNESQVTMDADKVVVTTWKKTSTFHQRHGTQVAQMSNSTNNVLRARRGVIRMLIIVVLTFSLCNLPYHARKMWIYWSDSYKGSSNFNALFTPLTFLATYFNSGINPLLYAFLSRNFRKGMRELILCSFNKSKNNKSSVHQRVPLQVASVVLQTESLPLDTFKKKSHKKFQREESVTKEQHTEEICNTEGI